jgi:tRNA pseudouridine(55) synthase
LHIYNQLHVTDTLDNTGTEVESVSCEHVTEEMLAASLQPFRGDIMQVPPMYSALKHNGKRLHKLARAGKVNTIIHTYTIRKYAVALWYMYCPSIVRAHIMWA